MLAYHSVQRFPGVFLNRNANARKSAALPLVSPPIPSSPSSSSLQRLTNETDVTDPGQMAYQAGNPWLQPKPYLQQLQAVPGRHHQTPTSS